MKLFLIFSLIKFSSAGFVFSEDPNLSKPNLSQKTESSILISSEPIVDQWVLQLTSKPNSLLSAQQIKEAILLTPELLTFKSVPQN